MQSETFYHIYNRANGSEKLFLSDDNYRFFLRRWTKYIEPIADTYCYCLMPNHFHYLIRTKDEDEVLKIPKGKQKLSPDLEGFENLQGLQYQKICSQHFSNLFNSYTKAFNKMYKRKGSLFIPNFKKKEITDERYLDTIIAYIHRNPVHHHYVSRMEDWEFSSYNTFFSDKKTKIMRAEIIDWFGGLSYFEKFHQQQIEKLHNSEYFLE